MRLNRPILLALAVLALAALAQGWTYWRIPYSQLNVTALWSPLLIGITLLPTVSRYLGLHPLLGGLAAGGSVPFVVMARVVVDGVKDPTSHNLWPFELVISGGLGLLVAATGAFLAWLVFRTFPRRAA
ncbi:MAG: hypothetical protein JST24_07610 [Acidobacteria bacterium]|nr:hypothetical protein [Acidobacteriota bacterium]